MAYRGDERPIIEAILRDYGYTPESLPNLYQLLVPRSMFTRPGMQGLIAAQEGMVPVQMREALPDLAGWRRAFPETIDSITRLTHTNAIPMQGDPMWMQYMYTHPHVYRMSGTPADLERSDFERPTLHEQVLADEPAGPRLSQIRMGGVIPDERFRYGAGRGVRDLSTEEVQGMSGLARRRLLAGERAFYGENYGGDLPTRFAPGLLRGPADRIAAEALITRLQNENPEGYVKLLSASPIGQERGYLFGPGNESPARRDIARRIASIYSQHEGRHSSRYVDPSLHTEDFEDLARYDPFHIKQVEGPSIYERMKAAEFKPGKTISDNLFDELDAMGKEPPKPVTNVEETLSRTARAASNPTNQRIQSILNEVIGFGKGQMAGAASPELLAKGAGGFAAGLLAPKLIDLVAPGDSAWNQALKGAATGAGWGSILGPEGALAGAGVGALASQIL